MIFKKKLLQSMNEQNASMNNLFEMMASLRHQRRRYARLDRSLEQDKLKDEEDEEDNNEEVDDFMFSKELRRMKAIEIEILDKSFDANNFSLLLDEMKNLVVQAYNDNGEDIEDFFDILALINNITWHCFRVLVLTQPKFVPENLEKMTDLRMFAKKQVKQKYRDFKNNQRVFWNCEEASFQYQAGIQCVWAPSVVEYTKVIKEFYETLGVRRDENGKLVDK